MLEKNPRSKAQKARRSAFLARHKKNIKKFGKLGASYWAAKVKW